MVASLASSLPPPDAMAPYLASEAPSAAHARRASAPPTASATEIERRLARTARVAAALLRAPAARAYLRQTTHLALRGLFPAGADAPGDDLQALTAAEECVRTGAPASRPWREARQPHDEMPRAESGAGSHLAVPLARGDRPPVGALVLSDPARERWAADEIEQLRELAHIAVDGIRPAEAAGPRTAPPAASPDPAAARAVARSGSATGIQLFSEGSEAALVENIRQSIVGGLHLGALRPGDRLPSIRQTARAFKVSPYMALQAYAELELEGLVERRERSGVFVATFERGSATTLPETGAWMTEVLTQACQHQVKIPLLPDLIRRWTSAVRVRCVCVESCVDSRFALSVELAQQFGIEAASVAAGAAAKELREADLIITTAYHAQDVRPVANEVRRPMLIATINPLVLSSALNHLRERDLTVICVDSTYGERLRALQGGAYRNRVRVVRVDDSAALATLDRAEAVLLTPAARQRLEQPDFRLVAPMYPSYSLDFARKVAEALVRINLQGARS